MARQFISQDPLSFAAGDANLYRRVGNGPINAIDPSGLDALDGKRQMGPLNKTDFYTTDQLHDIVIDYRAGRNAAETLQGGLYAVGVAPIVTYGQSIQSNIELLKDPLGAPKKVWTGAQQSATDVLTIALNPKAYVESLTPEQQGQFWAGTALAVTGVAMAYAFHRGTLPDNQTSAGIDLKSDPIIVGSENRVISTTYAGIDLSTSGASNSFFLVGRHGEMPKPRSGYDSHHGVLSYWVKSRYSGYDPDKAPAVLMSDYNHRKTFGVYQKWRAAARERMGGRFTWSNVSEADMRSLSEQMFDAANVPNDIRQQYWTEFEKMKRVLQRSDQ